jgi:hypothetical protein
VLGHSVPDNQSGYRLLSRRLMEATLDSREPGFHFEIEMIVTCVQRGFNLELVPIRTIYAGETSHIKPIPFVIDFFRMLWQTRRQVQKGKQERLNE